MRKFFVALAALALSALAAHAQVSDLPVSPSVTISAAGCSAPIVLSINRSSPLVSLLVNVSSGATLSGGAVEIAGSVSGPWNNHDTLVNLTASANGNLSYPMPFVRICANSLSGGTVTLTAIQQNGP